MVKDNHPSELSNNYIKLWWRSIDQQTVIALVILFVFSIMLVTSSGSAVANRIGLNEHYFASRQLVYLAVASILIIFFSSLSKNLFLVVYNSLTQDGSLTIKVGLQASKDKLILGCY